MVLLGEIGVDASNVFIELALFVTNGILFKILYNKSFGNYWKMVISCFETILDQAIKKNFCCCIYHPEIGELMMEVAHMRSKSSMHSILTMFVTAKRYVEAKLKAINWQF